MQTVVNSLFGTEQFARCWLPNLENLRLLNVHSPFFIKWGNEQTTTLLTRTIKRK